MSKTKIIAIAASSVAVLIPVGLYIQFVGSTAALCERFPQVPKDLVWKISKEMWWEALSGKYNNLDTSDAGLDRIFLAKREKYLAS